jgi:hypothetical protein
MGESARDDSQMHSHFGSCKCLEPWLEKKTSTKLGPQDTIKRFLKCKYLKCPCIVHLDLICMSYGQKKGWESNCLIPDHKSLERRGQMSSNCGVLYTVEKIFLRAIVYSPCIIKTDLIWEGYEHPKFLDNKSPNFGTPTWESWGKVTFGCSPHREAYNIL